MSKIADLVWLLDELEELIALFDLLIGGFLILLERIPSSLVVI